jgi:RNA 2',3'-cyclic 3'-phosphodiesterase
MRLFVGIRVGDEVHAVARRVRTTIEHRLHQLRAEPPRLVWVVPASLHLTLRFLGEWPESHVPAIVEAVQAPFEVPPFAVGWHGPGAFPSPRAPRAIWLGVSDGARQLGQLEAEVARRLGGLMPGEEAQDARPFHPHLTLARVKTLAPNFDWPAVLREASVEAVRSPVTQVTLFRSRGWSGGAGYEEIGCGHLHG